MKKIALGFGVLAFIVAVIAGTTGAYFTDSKTTGDNKFHAGTLSIGLSQDMHASLPVIVNNWAPGENATVQFDIKNTGTLSVNLRTYHIGSWDFTGSDPKLVKFTTLERFNDVNSTWVQIQASNIGIDGYSYFSPDGFDAGLYEVKPGEIVHLRHVMLFDPVAGNSYQGKTFTANITVDAKQVTAGATWPNSSSVPIACSANGDLNITRTSNSAVISWATSVVGKTLQSSASVAGPWTNVATNATVINGCYVVTDSVGANNAFYRLNNVTSGVPTFSFTSPSQNSTVVKGTTYTINWTSQNITGNEDIAINLKNVSTGNYINQFTGIKNTGSVSWTVPANLTVGNYVLTINNCLSSNTSTCVSYEGPTVIVAEPQSTNNGQPLSLSTQVSGSTYVKGQTYRIDWDSTLPTSEKLAIQLKNLQTGNYLVQGTGISNSGTLSWTMSSTLAPGLYEMSINNCLSGNSGACVTSKTDGFVTIVNSSPRITLSKPTQSTVARGGQIAVEWSTTLPNPSTTPLTITLRDNTTGAVVATADGIPASSGSIAFSVPTSVVAGSYKIVVSTCGTFGSTSCVLGSSNKVEVTN